MPSAAFDENWQLQLGQALNALNSGAFNVAEQTFRSLDRLQPGHPMVLQGLAAALHRQGQTAAAVGVLDDAAIPPAHAATLLSQRAALRLALNDNSAALADCDSALRTQPEHFSAHYNRGLALQRLGHVVAALDALTRASSLRADDDGVRLAAAEVALQVGQAAIAANLLSALRDANRPAARMLVAQTALALGNAAAALNELDALPPTASNERLAYRLRLDALLALGRTDAEIGLLQERVALAPEDQWSGLRLANRLLERGEPTAALQVFERLVSQFPQDSALYSALLVASSHDPNIGPHQLLERSRAWPRPTLPSSRSPSLPVRPGPRPRIGMVSPRFLAGPMASFLLPVLAELRQRGIDVLLYDCSGTRDESNARFRALATDNRDIAALDDEAAAQRIRDDRIDILIDLTGHSPGNRLGLFLHRPAAREFTWLDYFATTGLGCFEALLSDEWLCPPGDEVHYSEPVVRLPLGRLCYALPENAPEPAPFDPELRWFGCFNRPNKLNNELLNDWAELLRALPDWGLLLKGEGSRRRDDAVSLRAKFAARGVEPDRLRLLGWSDYHDTLRAYHDVAIALDTHPFSGCATTLDALWMGVPVLTRCGSTMASRQSTAILERLGLPTWCASTAQGWLNQGIGLANDCAGRRDFRLQSRESIAARLANAPAFVDALLGVFRVRPDGAG